MPRSAKDADLQLQYGMWLGLSKAARESAGLPLDQKSFADRIGIREETLCNWKKNDLVKQAQKNVLALFLGDAKFDIIRTMIERAKDPKGFQDRKIYFEMTGDLSKKGEKSPTEKVEVKFIIESPPIKGNYATDESPDNVPDKTEFRGAEEVPGESDQ